MASVRTGERKISSEVDEFMESAYDSLLYIDIILKPLCTDDSDKMEETEDRNCTIPSEEESLCDIPGLLACVDLSAVVINVKEGGRTGDTYKACR